MRNDVKDEETVNLLGEEEDEEKGEEEMEEAGEQGERTRREIKGPCNGSDSFISKESAAVQRTSPELLLAEHCLSHSGTALWTLGY